MLEKLKNKIEAAQKKAEKLKSAIQVDEETRNKRLSICQSCEHLFKPTNTCKKCGCFMVAKTWIGPVSCPIGKWSSVDPADRIETADSNS